MLVVQRIVAFLREFRKGAFRVGCPAGSLGVKSGELIANAIQRLTKTGFATTQSHSTMCATN